MEKLRASQSMVDYFKKEQEAILKDENFTNKEELKQETLEEASEYYSHNYFDMHETNNYKALKQGFEAGAKWQQEQDKNKFSEEEVIQIIRDFKFDSIEIGDMNPEKWFEHFKKK
jgi:hypothetical protein